MSWHFLERWLEKTNQHSTLLGKFWITFLIVVRMVVVASIGDRVYNDDQSEFKCNTQQPGCTNVCFNKFSPMSHLRFWSFQIIFVATPSVIYIVYSGHTSKLRKAQSKRPRPSQIEDEEGDDDEDQGEGGDKVNAAAAGQPPQISGSRRAERRNFSLLSSKKRSKKTGKDSLNMNSGSRRHSRHGDRKGGPRKGTPPNYDETTELIVNGSKRLLNEDARVYPRSAVIRLVNPETIQGGGRRYEQIATSSGDGIEDDRRRIQRSRSGSRISAVPHVVPATVANNNIKIRHNNSNNNNNTTNEQHQKQQQHQQGFTFVWREPTVTNNNNQRKTNHHHQQKLQTGETSNRSPSFFVKPRDQQSAVNGSESDDENKKDTNGEAASLLKDQHHHDPRHNNVGTYYTEHDRYMDILSSQQQLVPTAPPEYPGFANNFPHDNRFPRKASSKASLKRSQRIPSDGSNLDEAAERKRETRSPRKTHNSKITVYPAFAQHFRWYLISVFLRLCMEVFFLYMQVRLYGFSVSELFKCERKPCPNKVDCFVSRPKEKTIFLWFMFIYSCICIFLNFLEIVYLIYSYIIKYSRGIQRSRSAVPILIEDSRNTTNDAQIIKHMSEERERIKGHELVSVAGPHFHGNQAFKQRGGDKSGYHHGNFTKYGSAWGKGKDIWRRESNYYKYPPIKFEFTNSHEMSDYMYDDIDSDERSADDSDIDRIAPDQLDDINIEYNEIDINDIPMDDDVNDVMNNNDDCV